MPTDYIRVAMQQARYEVLADDGRIMLKFLGLLASTPTHPLLKRAGKN